MGCSGLATVLLFVIYIDVGSYVYGEISGKDFLKGPLNSSVLIKSGTRLRCRINNPAGHDITVQWIKDGFGYENNSMQSTFKGRYHMPGSFQSGNYDLIIRDIELEDDGEYECQATVILYKEKRSVLVTSERAQLNVVEPPKSIEMKQYGAIDSDGGSFREIVGPKGQDILVYCSVDRARPAAQIGWYLSGSPLSSTMDGMVEIMDITKKIHKSDYLNKTRSVLRMKLQLSTHESLLECRLENTKSYLIERRMKAVAMIHVLYIEKATVRSQTISDDLQYRAGSLVTYVCLAEAFPRKLKYRWELITNHHARQQPIKNDPGLNSVQIKLSRDMHKANLFCFITNSPDNLCQRGVLPPTAGISEWNADNQGNSWDPRRVVPTASRIQKEYWFGQLGNIDYAPNHTNCSKKFHLQTKSVEQILVSYGPIILDSAQTTLPASIGRSVTLQCVVDANPSAMVTWYRGSANTEQILISRSARQVIRIDSEDKFGVYTCVARSPGFRDASKLVYVLKSGQPEIISEDIVYANLGQAVKIVCTARSVPHPRREDVKWFRLDGSLIAETRYQIYQEKFPEGVKSILYIPSVFNADFDKYNCSIGNEHGHQSKIITLCPSDEAPLAFAVGSGVAVVFALAFSFIIVCIVKRGQHAQRNQLQQFYKDMDIPNSNGVNYHPESLPMYTAGEDVAESINGGDLLWKEHTSRQLCSYPTFYKGSIDRQMTVKKVEWKDEAVYQDVANESTRSADSGVCPDDIPNSHYAIMNCPSVACSHFCTAGTLLKPLSHCNLTLPGHTGTSLTGHPSYTFRSKPPTSPIDHMKQMQQSCANNYCGVMSSGTSV